MNPVLRFCFLLLVALLCCVPAGWLLLVCAELTGFDSCLAPRPGWIMFSAFCALATLLPPVLHAWPDESRPLSELVREALRAALFSFALCALAFLALMRPLRDLLGLPDLMMSTAASVFAPFIACLLACASYFICCTLLPRTDPDASPPPSMRLFSWLSLALSIALAVHPWLIGNTPPLFSGGMTSPAVVCLFLALRYALVAGGDTGVVPAWGALCLFCGFRVGTMLPDADAADLAFCALLLLLCTASCLCLLRPESRRWLC